MDLEGGDRVAVKSGDENDRGRHAALQHPEHTETIEPRHLDVQDEKVGFRSFDARDRLEPIVALRHHLESLVAGKVLANPFARERLVVDDDGSDTHGELLKSVSLFEASLRFYERLRQGFLSRWEQGTQTFYAD